MLNYTTSEENYIKAIFQLQHSTGTVTTNKLANVLKTKPASVTDMMKKLKSKKLLHYQPYQGFHLSQQGKKVALAVVRRHRLWEYFLAEKLKFTWDEVHAVADDLEHVSSKKLIDKLDEYLGHPKFDPHGDPIPDMHGRIKSSSQVCILEFPLNKPALVSNVSDQSSEILELLKHKHIAIGTRLELKKRFSFDNSIEATIINKQGKIPSEPFTVSEQLARNIFVTPVPVATGRRRNSS